MQAEASRSGPAVVVRYRDAASLAQKAGRHGDAVRAFQSALAALPPVIATAGRDANAARLQLLVHLSRSRLALGEPAEALSDLANATNVMAALDGAIPSRAIETVRAAVLANGGVALAMLGRMDEAEANFATSLAAIERLGTPELDALRKQVLDAWSGALNSAGREADARAMLAAFGGTSRPAHDQACGCGHDHAHGASQAHPRGEACGCDDAACGCASHAA